MTLEIDLEEIPTLRTSKLRLFSVIEDENADIRDVERIIESDPAMAAKVIRIANSAFYGHAKTAKNIHDAVLVIGFDMVRCITLSMAVMQTFSSKEKIASELWRHSFAVALTALSMGRSRDERSSLFSGGLLHDLGRVVLVWKEPDAYIPLFQDSWPNITREQETFTFDHTMIGETVAQRWHFPSEVIDIIRHHHAPVSRLSSIIFLADLVVHQEEKRLENDLLRESSPVQKYLGETYPEFIHDMRNVYRQSMATIEGLI
jgi:putative nucleotidyltransferase with HDIG domain